MYSSNSRNIIPREQYEQHASDFYRITNPTHCSFVTSFLLTKVAVSLGGM
jgi:hypothetical protein